MKSRRGDATIIRQWLLRPHLMVEASASAVELVITSCGLDERRRDGEMAMAADAPDTETYRSALLAARAWQAAVYMPGHTKFTAAMRSRAYANLEDAGVTAPSGLTVTAFLADWQAQQANGLSMMEYAREWA